MGVGGGTAALLAVAVAVAVASSPAGGWTAAAAAEEEEEDYQGARPPCFHACFDQCVPRDEFWFCQLSCYLRCAGAGYPAFVRVSPGRHPGCEQSCALSLCGQLRPGSKVMAACRDTCRKSYAVAAARDRRPRAVL